MQQYRVNYVLLVGLLVGMLVASGAVYAVWRFQIDRNAGSLIAEAERNLAESNYRQAALNYGNYLSIRPTDDEVRVKWASAWADVADQPDMAPEDLGLTFRIMEDVVRSLPEQKQLQRRLVDLYGRYGQVQGALDHLGLMLTKFPEDSELQVLQMQYLARAQKLDLVRAACVKLVGYDETADSFDAQKAVAPHDASVYGTFAALLRGQEDQPVLADRVMDQLIEVNPESPDAYLQRGQYYITYNETDKGERDIEKAYALDPDDADVLLAMAERAESNEKLDQAREFIARANEKYPEDPRFYQALAGLEMKNKKYEEALALIAKGLKEVPGQEGNILLAYKADLQFLANDIKGVQDSIGAMRQGGFRPDYVELMEARVLLAQNKWFQAARALQRLRPKMTDMAGFADQVDFQLGLCYERLGQPDEALKAYNLVLQHNPANEPAQAGRQRILAQTRPSGEDREGSSDLDAQISQIMAKPENERDWSKIDAALTKLADERELKGAARELFWAQVLLRRSEFAAASKRLIEARKLDPENILVERTIITLLRLDPSQGPAKALQKLDLVQEKFGDQAALRLDRADLLVALNETEPNDERLKQRLAELADAPSDWTNEEKIGLWSGMAGKYLVLGMRDESRSLLDRVADMRADDLPTRAMLFALALEANDDVGMRTAQDDILKIVGTKNDSMWLFTEARRMISLYRRGELGRESLSDVRSLIDKAFRQRPDWFELNLVKAELELLDENEDLAYVHFQRAEKTGRLNPAAALQYVRLLANRGEFEPAKRLIEQLPKAIREGELALAYAEILLNTGDVTEALQFGRKHAEADPNNADRQLKYGQFLARCAASNKLSKERQEALLVEAGRALERAVEAGPESPDAWLALVTYYVLRKEEDNTELATQRAQLALADDELIPFLARCYEIQRQWFNAENMHLTMFRANAENLRSIQQLAAFYLGPGYRQADMNVKATPLINQILRAGADDKLAANEPTLMWARRVAAQMLATSRDYQQLLKAEKLLASNTQDGVLTMEDQLLTAQILAPRPEPVSRIKAMQLLEEISKTERLNLQSRLVLGQLYFTVGSWQKCRTQMLQTISSHQDSVEARTAFIRMILVRGDKGNYDEAARQLAKLQEIAPGDSQTIELMVRLAGKTGKEQSARAYLLRLLPKVSDPKEIPEEQLPLMEFVGTLLVDVGDLNSAEKVYRAVAAREPKKVLALASFLGLHRDAEQSMNVLEQAFKPESAHATAQVAIAVIRARRDEVGERYDSRIQAWMDRALLENPDSIPLLMLQAEFADVREQYDEAADIYRKVLARKELMGVTRAIVLNNLAFLVSLAGSEVETGIDPMELVQEAEQILGPTADILDTRAIVHIARKDYQKAIRDLEYSVTDNPTPSKYFHKTVAHLGAGENNQALEAWEKAEQLGDIRRDINRMERDLFDGIKTKIDQLRSQNVHLTDADAFRAAG